jgi:hypothetical protein
MAEDDHRRHEADLAAYLLDALEPDERRAFRTHLEGCARCQRDERWLRAAAEVLPSSVEQIEPSPALRKRLMDRVQVEAASDRAPIGERLPRRRRWTLGLRPAVALAAVTVVAIVGAALGGYLIGQEDDGGPSTQVIQAEATPEEPNARARMVRIGDTGYLRVERLPVQRSDRVYQAWLQRGMKFERSTPFIVGEDGSGSVAVRDLEGVDAVLVTNEPEPGSPQPTTDPLLVAKL